MPSLNILRTLIRELSTRERAPRIPEPGLVMDDAAQVAAYFEAGRPGGVMTPVYIHHAAQACDVIRPGDFVVDLACGPANQLSVIAQANPASRFLGVDLSEPMLERARGRVREAGLRNVEFRVSDISALSWIEDVSVDAVISTMALHHLPTEECLRATFAEIARILRPGGGVWLVDFGHLKSEKSIRYFAHQYSDRQPDLFTLDYLNSLRAAFPVQAFRDAMAPLRSRARLFTTFLAPYMVAVKSAPRRPSDPAVRDGIRRLRDAMPAYHRKDLDDLVTFFRLGGLSSGFLP